MTKQEKKMRIAAIEKELEQFPKGKIFYKTIKGKEQPYLQWYEDGKTVSKYVKVKEREEVFRQLEQRDQLLEELDELKAAPEEKADPMDEIAFKTNVVSGAALEDLIRGVNTKLNLNLYKREKM